MLTHLFFKPDQKFFHKGRGYIPDQRDAFLTRVTPVFIDAVELKNLETGLKTESESATCCYFIYFVLLYFLPAILSIYFTHG